MRQSTCKPLFNWLSNMGWSAQTDVILNLSSRGDDMMSLLALTNTRPDRVVGTRSGLGKPQASGSRGWKMLGRSNSARARPASVDLDQVSDSRFRRREIRVIPRPARQSIVRKRHQFRLGIANPGDICQLWQSRRTSRRNPPEELPARLNEGEQHLGIRSRHRCARLRGRTAIHDPTVCSLRFNLGTLPR